MNEPNEAQQKLINQTEGIHLVDAGAGTGKTFALTKRYRKLLEKTEPEEILMLTFSKNAASQMEEEVLKNCETNPARLRNAPISTFHSFCNRLIRERGLDAPKHLGMEERFSENPETIENEVLRQNIFEEFLSEFKKEHDYEEFFNVIWNESSLLRTIRNLATKGIFPTREGWYRNSEKHLDGNLEKFMERFEKLNRREGNRQSEMCKKVKRGLRNRCYLKTPDREELIRNKKINPELAKYAFREDRGELKEFVHDLFYEFLKYQVEKDYLSFHMMTVFAYIAICEDERIRERNKFDYVMVDEFQDTNELQLKILLLLSRNGNICVVGDWKQGIYGFRHATIQNILNFEERAKEYISDLNEDERRVSFEIDEVNINEFKKSFRCQQEILDFAERSLTIPATYQEDLDKEKIREDITSLEAHQNYQGHSEISCFSSEDEKEAVLAKIEEIVDNPDYKVKDGEEYREIKFSDIAVLSRTKKFALELQEKSFEYGIPMSYESGIDLFTSKPSILLLAWLRILNEKNSQKGWSVVLDEEGLSLPEIKSVLNKRDYPKELSKFRKELLGDLGRLPKLIKRVFDFYGLSSPYTEKIIDVLQSASNSMLMDISDLIKFIESNIENETAYEIERDHGKDSASAMTIHSAKGLEYPVVFVSGINRRVFPSSSRDKSPLVFDKASGLRLKKIRGEKNGYVYNFNNWKADLATLSKPDYGEERRLFYVAMSRAKQYLFLTAGERPSNFYEEASKDYKIEPPEELEIMEREVGKADEVKIEMPEEKGKVVISPHDIIDIEEEEAGRGPEFGTKVHEFAEKYTLGKDVSPSDEDEKNVKDFIESLEGESSPEVPCSLPIEAEERKVIFNGIIDLVNVTEDSATAIDYKTDTSRKNEEEYRKQLSIYKRVLKQIYPEKEIHAKIFYTRKGKTMEIEPVNLERISSEMAEM